MFFTAISFQAKHATTGNGSWGVDGENGNIVDMHTYGVWEPYSVKAQTYKTAIEVREREGEREREGGREGERERGREGERERGGREREFLKTQYL